MQKEKFLIILPTIILFTLFIVAGLIFSSYALAQAGTGTIHVATTGADFAGCGDAGSPCKTIQFAVNQAVSGDEIKIAAGTYKEAVELNYNSTYNLGPQGIILTGVGPGLTIIDGENTRGPLINLIYQNSNTVIQNLTLKRGISTIGAGEGAGARIFFSNATLRNLIIENNNTSYGGGVYVRGGAPRLENVTLSNNQAEQGGGFYAIEGSAPILRAITVTNNTITGCCGVGMMIAGSSGSMEDILIEDNHAPAGHNLGGGAYFAESSTTIKDAVIRSNESKYGAGFYLAYESSVLIEDTLFDQNSAVNEGGGLTITGNESNINTSTLRNVTIQNNTADWGGGIYMQHGATPQLSGTLIQSNTAQYGGGFFFERAAPTLEQITVQGNHASIGDLGNSGVGGGMFIEHASSILLKNSIIQNNRADNWGGGIAVARNTSSPTFINNFIYNNTAPLGAAIDHETWVTGNQYPNGETVQPRTPPTKIYHNTIVGNSQDGIYCRQSPTNDLLMTNLILWDNNNNDIKNCSVIPAYSIIEQGTFGEPTNSTAAPTFANQSTGDLHLTAGSEGIDGGSSTPAVTDDIDNQQRDSQPDIGADEALADLSVTKSAQRNDDNVTFVISFSNIGSLLATGVRLTDTISLSLTNISLQNSGASINQIGTPPNYVWQVQDLSLNQGGAITVNGTYTGRERITNTVSVGMTSFEFDITNNTAYAATKQSTYLPLIIKN